MFQASLLDPVQDSMSETVFRRARHVTTENERVEEFMKAASPRRSDAHGAAVSRVPSQFAARL